jgi:hypothetical protein
VVRSELGKAFQIRSVRTDVAGVTATARPEDQDNSAWIVQIEAADSLPAGVFKGSLSIDTTDGDVPSLRVPFIGLSVRDEKAGAR